MSSRVTGESGSSPMASRRCLNPSPPSSVTYSSYTSSAGTGSHGTTRAPASARALPASRTARRTAGDGVSPPSSSQIPTVSPATSIPSGSATGTGGTLGSTGSPSVGSASTRNPRATSATVRAIGPHCGTMASCHSSNSSGLSPHGRRCDVGLIVAIPQ